ncbi:MAG: SDR family NAD(P)-dependent oxidoreductase [Acidimicrobiales bacterium]
MTLQGKRFVVTGAARGMGASISRAFVANGATVARLDVNIDPAIVDEPGSFSLRCDVSSRSEVVSAFRSVADLVGGIDGLVHAAGVERRSPAESIDDAEWNEIIDVNLRGTFLTNQAVFPYLQDQGGRIINFGSDAGVSAHPFGAHYAASKGGVIAWTRTIAQEWGRYGITANTVLPAIWTPMYAEYRGKLSADDLERHDAGMSVRIPIDGRLGDPDRDLAPVVVFLASDASRFVTGQLISVNGGLGTTR